MVELVTDVPFGPWPTQKLRDVTEGNNDNLS